MARRLALSSGRKDSFSSIANVVMDATLFPSTLAGFAESEEEESCVTLSSVDMSLTSATGGRDFPEHSTLALGLRAAD